MAADEDTYAFSCRAYSFKKVRMEVDLLPIDHASRDIVVVVSAGVGRWL